MGSGSGPCHRRRAGQRGNSDRGLDSAPGAWSMRCSLVKCHAGETDALAAEGVHILIVMKQSAARRRQRFQESERRRQATDIARVGFVGDKFEITGGVGSLGAAQEE